MPQVLLVSTLRSLPFLVANGHGVEEVDNGSWIMSLFDDDDDDDDDGDDDGSAKRRSVY